MNLELKIFIIIENIRPRIVKLKNWEKTMIDRFCNYMKRWNKLTTKGFPFQWKWPSNLKLKVSFKNKNQPTLIWTNVMHVYGLKYTWHVNVIGEHTNKWKCNEYHA